MNQDYAKAFRVVRAAFGLRQAELAARLPITASQLSLIEAGRRQPSVRVIGAMANAVGVPTALISLLASTEMDVERKANREISDLAVALLRILVTAKLDPQQELTLSK